MPHSLLNTLRSNFRWRAIVSLLGLTLPACPGLRAVNYEVYPGSAFYPTQMVDGTPGFMVYLQASTNRASSSAWSRVATNYFDGTGSIGWTNLIKPNASLSFFRIEAS